MKYLRLFLLELVASLACYFISNAFAQEQASLRRDVAALEAVRDRLVAAAKPQADLPATVLELKVSALISFPGRGAALGRADLNITLRRNGTPWLPGTALSSRWAPGPHFVDVADLTLADKEVKGTLRVHLNFARGSFHHHAVGSVLTLTVTGQVETGKVTGTYVTTGVPAVPVTPWWASTSDGGPWRMDSSAVPARSGAPSGSVRVAAWNPALPAAPPPDVMLDGLAVAARDGRWLETKAAILYRQIYAAALAAEHNLALGHAWELTPAYQPARPESKPAATKGGKASKPPALPGDDLFDERAPAKPAADRAQVAATLLPMATSIAEMRRLAEGYRPVKDVIIGNAPDLPVGAGPWVGGEPLGRDNALPADLATWRRVGGWKFVGPLPALYREVDVAGLPELTPAWDLAQESAATEPEPDAKTTVKDDDETAVPTPTFFARPACKVPRGRTSPATPFPRPSATVSTFTSNTTPARSPVTTLPATANGSSITAAPPARVVMCPRRCWPGDD